MTQGYLRGRRFLLGSGTLCCLAGVSAIIAGTGLPLSQPPDSGDQTSALAAVRPRESGEGKELQAEDFKFVWGKQLRRPLVDPPPPKPKVVDQPRQAPVVPEISFQGKLVGTLVDSDPLQRRGWLRIGAAPSRMVSQGQTLEDVAGRPEVVSIDNRTLVLRIGDREVTLSMEEESRPLFRDARSE